MSPNTIKPSVDKENVVRAVFLREPPCPFAQTKAVTFSQQTQLVYFIFRVKGTKCESQQHYICTSGI